MATCSSCAAELPDGARFCMQCGTPAPARVAVCAGCGDELPAGARFCPSCGTPAAGGVPAPASSAAPVAERRVTSVLFGDLVGFTPLSESRDSEEVRELLSAYFQQCRVVVARYGGTVEKFIGDAVMAVWGVPVAHEDDAERAVRAGLELVAMVAALGEQVGVPGLAQRVGIVTGEVAVTVGATAEGMVAGDAVNTAARVQAVASPGQVWVDEATRALASAAITFEDVGDHELKGKASPVRLWRAGSVVSSVGGAQRVDGLEAPFTGRDADLRLVKELFHATQESGRPRLVVLDGEAGVGKSRLAWEFEKYTDGLTASIRWHRGRCLSYGDGVAFWALAEALRARFGLVESDTGAVVSERLDAGLAEFVPDAGEREWLRPRLAVLLGEAGAGSFAREDLFAAWTAFLEYVAAGRSTVVLVLDDTHHADDGMLDFLDHVIATAQAPIFVLALARPELMERRPSLGGRRATVVRLEPLDDEAMAALVDGLVSDLMPATRAALVERAEGVPLFAVETVRALIDRDLVVPRGGRYVTAEGVDLDLDAIGAPATLQALVAARLDALDPDERRVVADASVLGLTFGRAGLLALGSPPQDLDRVLDSLRRREILTVQTDRFTAERGQHRFVQSVVRQVAYSTMSKRDRKARHVAAADHLASETDPADDLAVVIGQHLLDALAASSETDADLADLQGRALHHLERAADRAVAVGAPGEAQRLLGLALSLPHAAADELRLRLAAARAALNAGSYASARDEARAAELLCDELGEDVQAGRAAAVQAAALMGLGENSAAIEVAERRWRLLDEREDADPALLELAPVLTRSHMRLSQYDVTGLYAERLLLLAEGHGDPAALATAFQRIGARYAGIGAPAAARVNYETAVSVAREHDLPEPLAMSLSNLAALLNSRDLVAARAYAKDARDVARRYGQAINSDYALANYLIASWQSGDLEQTVGGLEEALDSVTDAAIRIVLRTLEAWVADATGRPIPSPGDDYSTTSDDDSMISWQGCGDITRALAVGDAARAAAIAAGTFPSLLGYAQIDDDFCVLWPPIVLAALAAGRLELADEFLAPVEAARAGQVSLAVNSQFRRLRGLVAAARGQDPARVEADLRAAVVSFDAFGGRVYRAQTQEELARWLEGQGRAAEAAPLVEAARATYEEMGATGWLRRLDAWQADRSPASAGRPTAGA